MELQIQNLVVLEVVAVSTSRTRSTTDFPSTRTFAMDNVKASGSAYIDRRRIIHEL